MEDPSVFKDMAEIQLGNYLLKEVSLLAVLTPRRGRLRCIMRVSSLSPAPPVWVPPGRAVLSACQPDLVQHRPCQQGEGLAAVDTAHRLCTSLPKTGEVPH